VTQLIWVLILLLGLSLALNQVDRRLRSRVSRARERALSVAKNLESPQFRVIAGASLPAWVAGRIAPLRAQFIALGFSEFLIYTRLSRGLNYTCVLLSVDGRIVVHVWVARSSDLIKRCLSVVHGWTTFKRELLTSARYALVTYFPRACRYETSPVQILAQASVAGESEYVIISEEMPLNDAIQSHQAGANAFAGHLNSAPISVKNEEQFLDIEREHCAKLAANMRRAIDS